MTSPRKKTLAFIDHSFHIATRSSAFFQDLLREEFEITFFPDDAWSGGQEVNVAAVNARNFDVVLFWQVIPSLRNLMRFTCPNITWVPMYDSEWRRSGLEWYALAALNVKVLCFSKALHRRTLRFGLNSYYAQYFPEPSAQAVSYGTARVFFWQRTSSLDWRMVKQILNTSQIETLVLRDDPDPGQQFVEPADECADETLIAIVRNLKLTGSTSQQAYWDLLSTCNVFIAPRLREGIGLSFLEAMALGMCVVAADLPTMNEYISDAQNGFLFNAKQPRTIDLKAFADCGRRARTCITQGRQQWLASASSILRFVAEPGNRDRPLRAMILVLLLNILRRLTLFRHSSSERAD